MTRLLLALCLGGLCASPGLAAPYFGTPTHQEWKQIEAGEVVVTRRTLPGTRIIEFTAMGRVTAPIEKLVRYYVDPKSVLKFQDAIKDQRLLAQEKTRARVHYLIGLPWPLGDREFTIETWVVPENNAVEWKMLAGNIRENQGSYAMAPIDARNTLVTYQARVDINTWVPPFLISWVQGGMIPKVIVKAREELEPAAAL